MISVNFKVLQTSVAVRTAGCRKGQWRNKAPKAFSCPAFGAPKSGPKPPQNRRGATVTLPHACEATQRPTRADTGHLLLGISAESIGDAKESRTNWHDSPNRIFGFTSPALAKCAAPAPSEVPGCNPKSSPCARSAWSDRIHAGSAVVPGHLRESYGSHRGRFLNRHA